MTVTPRSSKEAIAPAATSVRTSGRGRLLHAASAPAPADEFSQTEEVGEKERAAAFASFEAALQEMLEERKGRLVEAVLRKEAPHIHTACGRGGRGGYCRRIIAHGVPAP